MMFWERIEIHSLSRRARLACWLLGAALLTVGSSVAQEPATAAQKPAAESPAVQQPAADTPATQPPAVEAGVPNLEVSTPVWDFGERWAGEKAETTITVKNTGTAVLKIDQVKSSCGCTVAQTKKKELAPGETEDIRITYNTKKNAEKVSQKIRIMTNDPDTPTMVVEVKGHVKQLIKMEGGPTLSFGNVGLNDTLTKSVEFECAYTEPFEVSLKENAAPFFDIQLETLEAGKRYKLTATTKPPLPDGSFTTNAVLTTGLELMPELSIRVWGIALGPVSVSPKVLYIMGDQDEPSTKTLQVICRGEKPITVTSAKADLESIQTEIMPQSVASSKSPDSVVTIVQIKLPPASELPDRDVALRIATDNPEINELIVPIRKNPGRSQRAANVASPKPVRERPSLSATPVEKQPKP